MPKIFGKNGITKGMCFKRQNRIETLCHCIATWESLFLVLSTNILKIFVNSIIITHHNTTKYFHFPNANFISKFLSSTPLDMTII